MGVRFCCVLLRFCESNVLLETCGFCIRWACGLKRHISVAADVAMYVHGNDVTSQVLMKSLKDCEVIRLSSIGILR